MRLIDEVSLSALGGSRPADTLTVWAWRDGSLVLPEPLQVVSWSVQDEAGDSVKVGQKLSLTVADPDGVLGAWRFDDPLGVAGTELSVIYRVGGAGAINFGRFRVVGNEPSEAHDSRVVNEYGLVVPDSQLEPHTRRVYVTTAVVKLEAVDLTVNVDNDRFWSPQSPPGGASILSEVARLSEAYFPVVVDDGVPDLPASRNMVFDRERLEAVQDLASRVGARYRMGGDGEMHVYPVVSDPVWRVEPGDGLVNVTRKQALTGLYNAWVVEGKDVRNGAPLQSVVKIETGPLRFGGPHGRNSFFYNSEMIESHAQATAYGMQLRDEFLNSLAIELSVETVPRPELQAGDWVEVGCPFEGRIVYLPGSISSLSRSGSPVPSGTSMTVRCSYAAVVAALRATEWAKDLTGGLPALTWDRMPATWGSLPAMTWDSLPA
jgi:hypothetical protein